MVFRLVSVCSFFEDDMQRIVGMALLLVVTCFPGCSSDSRVAVEGNVTFAGQPLDVGTITFLPASGDGVKCGGLIENGQYKVEQKLGLAPGQHRVEIRWSKSTGKKSRNEFGEEIIVRQEGLPDKFHTNSTLTAEVKSGENFLDFKLEE
jgi:hypothetical protein